MPRLLLVDDNPSIHRIAESLLSPTDVELVCVDSAAEALDRLAQGERFDVALVDTAMPGMDGWTLLDRLRAMEGTARMPIALMAGVLDPVDPAKLAKAPVQGFLKKPIELRELGDRVKALMAKTVASGPSPFSTVPATPAQDLVKQAEEVLPEFRPGPSEVSGAFLPDAEEEDLLLLDEEDLWPEAASEPSGAPSAPSTGTVVTVPEVHLELEELDLDSLQDLANDTLPGLEPLPEAAAAPPPPAPVPLAAAEDEHEDYLVTMSGLEELEVMAAAPASSAAPFQAEPPAAAGQSVAPLGQAAAVSTDQARAVVQAMLADPVLVDALVKAVVARMGDQVLREVAWEVMPDLAGRLQR